MAHSTAVGIEMKRKQLIDSNISNNNFVNSNTSNSNYDNVNNERYSQLARLDKSTQRIKDSIKLTNDTCEIGNQILLELEKQRNQLEKIGGNVNNINNGITTSNGLLRKMVKPWWQFW